MEDERKGTLSSGPTLRVATIIAGFLAVGGAPGQNEGIVVKDAS